MKLFLQRDTSDVSARYQVYDELGTLRYIIKGKRNPSGESCRISDLNDSTLCSIRSLGFSALSVYNIRSGDESIMLNIAVSGGRVAVRFRGISFYAQGDVLTGSYSVLDADTAVVCSAGRDFSKSCTQLDVFQEERELFCLAIAACIDSLSVGSVPALQMT